MAERATRSVGAGRSGLGAARSGLVAVGVAGRSAAVSIRVTVAAGLGVGAAGVPGAFAAPAAESAVTGASVVVLATVLGDSLFLSCDQTTAASSTAASTPPAISSRRTVRIRAACFDFRIACSTVTLSDTDVGSDGPLSIARTPLRSFAMSSALW